MNEQQHLSAAYSTLKESYRKLKDSFAMRGITINTQKELIDKLYSRISNLEKDIAGMKDDSVMKLPKKDANGHFVTLKRFNKMKKLAEYYATRFGESEKANQRLRLLLLQKHGKEQKNDADIQ